MRPIATGATLSAKDKRDIIFTVGATPEMLYGSSKNITNIAMLASEYQGKQGKCTSYLKSIIEWLYYKQTGVYVELSEDFLYIVTKNYIDKNWIEGSSLRSAIQAAMKYGVCREAIFPSDSSLTHEQLLARQIPQEAWNDALKQRIGGYMNIPIDPSLIKLAIDKFGMLYSMVELGDKWWTPSWNKNDILPLKKSSPIVGGHAICIYGYMVINGKLRIYFKNSWSTEWGDNGCGYFDYDDYKPHLRECFGITLESLMHMRDNSPKVEESVWRGLLDLFRKINIIK